MNSQTNYARDEIIRMREWTGESTNSANLDMMGGLCAPNGLPSTLNQSHILSKLNHASLLVEAHKECNDLGS